MPRLPNWQLRAQLLEQQLLAERQRFDIELTAAHTASSAELSARTAAETRVLVLERTVRGLRDQLAAATRDREELMRRHGLGDRL